MHPVICMITDGRLTVGANADAWLARVVAAARAGAHLIQIRERQLDDRNLTAVVARSVVAVRDTRARVIVNDRLDVAVACGAHGVQLRSDSFPAGRGRAITPPGFLIGRSIHSAAEVAAAGDAVDFLIFGTVFATASKPGRTPAGTSGLAEAVRATAIPVLGVGGVTAGNAADVARTGAAGIAAIGLFGDADRASSAVNQMVHAFDLAMGGS